LALDALFLGVGVLADRGAHRAAAELIGAHRNTVRVLGRGLERWQEGKSGTAEL